MAADDAYGAAALERLTTELKIQKHLPKFTAAGVTTLRQLPAARNPTQEPAGSVVVARPISRIRTGRKLSTCLSSTRVEASGRP